MCSICQKISYEISAWICKGKNHTSTQTETKIQNWKEEWFTAENIYTIAKARLHVMLCNVLIPPVFLFNYALKLQPKQSIASNSYSTCFTSKNFHCHSTDTPRLCPSNPGLWHKNGKLYNPWYEKVELKI